MKLAIISDVHGKWQNLEIPECDVLISCGDYSFRGEKHLVKNFHEWLNKQEAGHIISVQGNHECFVEKNFQDAKTLAESVCPAVHFMEEGEVVIEGVKFWCSAWTPWFYSWAYNAHRGPEIKRHWDLIPDDTQVLITHGPPAGILDAVYFADGTVVREQVGCQDLMNRINELKDLKLHCFGHIHCSTGEQYFNGVKFINASICDEQYLPVNPVRVFEF